MTSCLTRFVQAVEGVEELLEDLFLSFEELDIVEQQNIDRSVSSLEFIHALLADAVDELVEELLGGDVSDHRSRVELSAVLTDRVQQVGLAEAGIGVDEQRVVVTARLFGNGHGRCVGKAVRLPDDEVVEGVLGNETWFMTAGHGLRDGGGHGLVNQRRKRFVGSTDGIDGQVDDDVGTEGGRGCFLNVEQVSVAHPPEVEIRRSDESQGVALEVTVERFEPCLPSSGGDPISEALMEGVPSGRGRVRLCHDVLLTPPWARCPTST